MWFMILLVGSLLSGEAHLIQAPVPFDTQEKCEASAVEVASDFVENYKQFHPIVATLCTQEGVDGKNG